MPRYKIFTDAGHGGKDPGVVNGSTKEKDLTLKIVSKLNNLLKRNFEVETTRETDVFVDLSERTKRANNFGANIFVSIHINSAPNNTAHGIESLVFYRSGDTLKLANNIHDRLIKATGTVDRGIKERQDLYVLKHTKMPAVLLELGFISNENEKNKLVSDLYQETITNAIYEGILAYFGMSDNSNTNQLKQDLEFLKSKGIINTPEYWLETAPKVKYLPELISKVTNRIKESI